MGTVSYTHLRAHETSEYLVCRLLLELINSSVETLKKSETLLITCFGLTTTPTLLGSSIGAIDWTVIGRPVIDANATALVNAPSNSLIFEVNLRYKLN